MELRVIYSNACCTKDQVDQIQVVYRGRLLELFPNPLHAMLVHDEWVAKGKPYMHRWPSYTKVAEQEATAILTPSTRLQGRAKVVFENER